VIDFQNLANFSGDCAVKMLQRDRTLKERSAMGFAPNQSRICYARQLACRVAALCLTLSETSGNGKEISAVRLGYEAVASEQSQLRHLQPLPQSHQNQIQRLYNFQIKHPP
jgi:hypothetical protein